MSTYRKIIQNLTILMVRAHIDKAKSHSKKISNDQELIQSDPISCPQNLSFSYGEKSKSATFLIDNYQEKQCV